MAGGDVRFTIRMSDSKKIECSVSQHASTMVSCNIAICIILSDTVVSAIQILYEIALAFGEVSPPLSLFTIVPRKRISEKDPVSVVARTSSVLFMEEDDDGWDPFMHGTHTTSNEMNGSKVVHSLKILNA